MGRSFKYPFYAGMPLLYFPSCKFSITIIQTLLMPYYSIFLCYSYDNKYFTFFFSLLPKMCSDVFGILHSNAYDVSRDACQIVRRDDEHFLRQVITPLYEVLMKVCMLHQWFIRRLCMFSNVLPKLVFCIWWQRKQKEVTKARRVIPTGETMMILMNIFGKSYTDIFIRSDNKILKALLETVFTFFG